MKLFSRKKLEFKTIQSDDEGRIFDSLEEGGWVMIDDPFSFTEPSRNLKRVRRFAMKEAEDRGAELLVESYDPYMAHLENMGLTYTAWRRATPEELKKRIQMKRLEEERRKAEMAARGELKEEAIEVNVEEVSKVLEEVPAESVPAEAVVSGSADEEIEMVSAEGVEAVSVDVNPYELAEKDYEKTLKGYETLEIEEVDTEKVTEEPQMVEAPSPELVGEGEVPQVTVPPPPPPPPPKEEEEEEK